MKSRIYKITNDLGMLLIIFSIVAYSLIVGANGQVFQVLLLGVLEGLSLVLLFIKKMVFKEQLIKSKIDIAVSIFMGCLFLPLLFNIDCSLQGSVEFIIKYIFVYAMYLLVRNIVDTTKKMNIIIATTIFSSLIIILLGIDIQHNNYFEWLIETLHLKYTNYNNRFSSTFGYSNAVSIYITFCIFLSINRIENTKKVLPKIIYAIYIILGSYIIYISKSRLVLLLYIFLVIMYLIIKNFEKIKQNKKKILIIVATILSTIIIATIYYILVKDYSRPYEPTKTFEFRRSFEPDTEYTIIFDVDVTEEEENKVSPQLIFYSVNKYLNEEEIGRVYLVPGEKIQKVVVNTPEDIHYIKLKIINWGNKKITINHCYINGEEHVFVHKYLPKVISRLIQSFSLEDTSIIQRVEYYNNCFKIAKDSILIGQGGNAWKRLSKIYQDYPYAVKESHSYFFELLISYGIVGVIAFVSIVVLLCRYLMRFKKMDGETYKKKTSIFTGLMALILYNFVFDFGLSFIIIILVVFVYIALLQIENKERINLKCVDHISLVAILVVFVILIKANIAKYLLNDKEAQVQVCIYNSDYLEEYIKESKQDDLELIRTFIEREPYKIQNDMYKYYWNAIEVNKEKMSKEKLTEYIDYGVNIFKTIKCYQTKYLDTITGRAKVIANAIKKLEKIDEVEYESDINQLKDILIDEYIENYDYVLEYKRNHRSKIQCEVTLWEYTDVLESVNIYISKKK